MFWESATQPVKKEKHKCNVKNQSIPGNHVAESSPRMVQGTSSGTLAEVVLVGGEHLGAVLAATAWGGSAWRVRPFFPNGRGWFTTAPVDAPSTQCRPGFLCEHEEVK